MSSNEAADQVVSMALKGIEVIARISGWGAKNLATYLYAVLRDQKKTRGKTRLEGLLRSGKELKVFAVKNEDLKKFVQEAKRYGVLYCALRDKKSIDGMCDIMVRAEDASKINRIVERFKLATVDTASIQSEIERGRTARRPDRAEGERTPAEIGTPTDRSADDFLDDIMTGPDRPEPEALPADSSHPTPATTEKPLPSEPISGRSGRSARGTSEPERKSVRQALREIREGRKPKPERAPAKDRQQTPAVKRKPKTRKPQKAR